MRKIRFAIIPILILFSSILAVGQVNYQPEGDNGFSIGSYGRVGVDWSFENGGSIGRRLNLNNMGSIGGRMEEQDYMELIPALIFKPFKEGDPTKIIMQTRFSAYSRSLSLFGNSSTSSLGGLTFAIPEYFVEASNINGKDLSIWIGARLYRGDDVGPADHFYFNDHSGQGFGIQYENTRFAAIFVSSTDTTSDEPPYFFINIGSGTPSLALRQRSVYILDHTFDLSEKHHLNVLGEIHYMSKTNLPGDIDIPNRDENDSIKIVLDYPADYGYVIGAKLVSAIGPPELNGYNRLAIRYGMRLANGGDRGISKTWNTFGAPNLEKTNFKGAYSISLVDDFFMYLSDDNSLNAYLIFTQSKGAADSDGKARTYLGREVYNRKKDFTVGFRDVQYISDKFHLLGEFHFSQRKDGLDDTYSSTKFSIVPTFVPTGQKSYWARPHFRFVFSLAHYNDAAKKNLYSPYLQFVGERQWGYYFGVKAEWWL
jgi:maltoporin